MTAPADLDAADARIVSLSAHSFSLRDDAIARPATYPWYPLAPSWIRQLSGPLKYS